MQWADRTYSTTYQSQGSHILTLTVTQNNHVMLSDWEHKIMRKDFTDVSSAVWIVVIWTQMQSAGNRRKQGGAFNAE